MKDAKIAPAFTCLYPVIARVTRRCSYALAVHGSMDRDFDLIAIPWTDDAVDPHVLVKAVLDEFGHTAYLSLPQRDPVLKPHGRLVWSLALSGGVCVDFGVMPRLLWSEAEVPLNPVWLTENGVELARCEQCGMGRALVDRRGSLYCSRPECDWMKPGGRRVEVKG